MYANLNGDYESEHTTNNFVCPICNTELGYKNNSVYLWCHNCNKYYNVENVIVFDNEY